MDNLKKYFIGCKNILLSSRNENIIKLVEQLNIQISYYDNFLNIIDEQFDVVFNESPHLNIDELTRITKKYLILSNIEDTNNVKLFMENNDDWIYNNNNWTLENKITVIKKKEENEKNIICVIKENANFYNPKSFELFDYYFNNNYKMVNKNIDNIINFIDEKNKPNNVIIFIHDTHTDQFDLNVVVYIQNNKNINSQIYIIMQDWWAGKRLSVIKNSHFRKVILKANNYKIIAIVDNAEMLADFNDENCLEFKNNIICYNYWGIYKSAIMEFNNNPIKKILISGCLARKNYPEREYMTRLNNKYICIYNYNSNDVSSCNMSDNNYSKELNKYLCCFSSSVHVLNMKQGKVQNTHIILLKTFEILASGSLLLVFDYEKPYLRKLGLIAGEHYLTLNFESNLNKQINILLDDKNIQSINKIRYDGYNYAINNLTNETRFKELNELFTK